MPTVRSTAEPSELARAAHVLRRLRFGAGPGAADQALAQHGSAAALVEAELNRAAAPFDPPGDLDADFDHAGDRISDGTVLVEWWLDRLRSPDAGLADRMAWHWHGHFTTSSDKSPVLTCWRQLRLLYTHGLGNFGELVRAVLDDAAMLVYLDADGSLVDEPNENLGRELLELFTLGRGNYSEDDVRATARVLAGRYLDWSTSRVTAQTGDDGTAVRHRTVTLFDGVEVTTLDDLTAAILAQRACAPFVVRRLWPILVGGEVDDDLVLAWGDLFRASGYEIAPLVATIARSDAFASSILARPRDSVEWYCAVLAAAGSDAVGAWDLDRLGQMPFRPPSVAGWPDPRRWVEPTQALVRGDFVANLDLSGVDLPGLARVTDGVVESGDDLVDAVLDRCSLVDVSASTRSALRALAADVLPFDGSDPTPAITAVLRAALACPEMQLA